MAKNICGYFPSLTMGNSLAYSSLIERDCLCVLEFKSAVTHIESQPFTIRYKDQTGKIRRYTPDILFIENSRQYLVECKPASRIEAEHTQRQVQAGRAWCAENNAVFLLVTDVALRSGIFLENVELLTEYARYDVSEADESNIIGMLLTAGHPLSVSDVMQRLCPKRPQSAITPILHLTYHDKIQIPMLNEKITVDSLVFLPTWNNTHLLKEGQVTPV